MNAISNRVLWRVVSLGVIQSNDAARTKTGRLTFAGFRRTLLMVAAPVFIGAFALGPPRVRADTLYGLSDNVNIPGYNQFFYSIDTTTGAATQIGTLSYGGGSLAFAPNGTLYNAAYGQLWEMNTITGTYTVVSTFVVPGEVDFIGFDQAGNLYGYDNGNYRLYRLDVNTGEMLSYVPLSGGPGAGLTGFIPGPNGTLITSTPGGSLYYVNPATGVLTVAGFSVPGSPRANTNIAQGESGAFYREVVGGVVGEGGGVSTLYAINSTTGNAVPIGSTAPTLTIDFEQIAAIPPLFPLTCPTATAQVEVAYSSALVASGGVSPYTYSISTGSLPGGLSLNTTTGAVTGTPSAAGAFSFTAQVADSSGLPAGTITSNCPITVSPPPLSVTPTSLSFGTVPRFSLLLKSVTLKNTGTSPVSVSQVSVTPNAGTGRIDFTPISLCRHSLAAGQSCPIYVLFFAGDLGSLSATLNIPNNAVGSLQAVPLSATVIPDRQWNPEQQRQ